jgi:16S rRNA C967 or C1407 C5-methylase (RsmB/RsmF family)/NOL1/NOP2/fmu family ribosome biogenesis protein
MLLPQPLLDALSGLPGFNPEAFIAIHQTTAPTSIRFNPFKPQTANFQPQTFPIPWSSRGYYLAERPSFTFDPLFHAGTYYVQEASSMFLEQALTQLCDLSQPLTVLDLCAAPGGKSTHLLSLLNSQSLLVSNETIRSRSHILTDNIMRWGQPNSIVTNNDPKDFARLENFFDVIVADAPCSGSGLFRREPEAIAEWSVNNVTLCSQRQQRILADVLPALKPGGLLIYATCSYSREEDEAIGEWLTEALNMQHEKLNTNDDWGVTDAGTGYRFYPYRLQGEGFYLACFRKEAGETASQKKARPSAIAANKTEAALLAEWLQAPQEFAFYLNNDTYYALPARWRETYEVLRAALKIVQAGVNMGKIFKQKLQPDHALALSTARRNNLPALALDYDTAIAYLRKQDIGPQPGHSGWTLATYQQQSLGWLNILPNRSNNYYPKELRILKQ